MRSVVIAMIMVAVTLTAVGVDPRVAPARGAPARLSARATQRMHVQSLKEARRRLELEHATLTAPDRIRRLATELGMTPVAPDRIRVIADTVKVAASHDAGEQP